MPDHHCHEDHQAQAETMSCHPAKGKPDFLLWGSLLVISILYSQYLWLPDTSGLYGWYATMATTVFDLVNTIWWSVLMGIAMVAVLAKIPREFVMSILGTNKGFKGIIRATAAGVLLDLCSHGILMVGAKLYDRGASIGQVMAFLIASPWNSFSLTLVLIALVGIPWTAAFIVLSMLIAMLTGVLFDSLVKRGVLPANPKEFQLPENFQFWPAARQGLSETEYSGTFFRSLVTDGIKESRMVMRWILFGVVLAALVKAFISTAIFGTYFGPTLAGLGLTLLVATIMEVCSEGSTPIAADLLTRAHAPGNAFAFLMGGVATDYTEIMVLKETTRSWKIALFLPLLSIPQVLLIAWLVNQLS